MTGLAREFYRRGGTRRGRPDLAYKAALYSLRHVFADEFENIIVSVDEQAEPSKALYERLAVLKAMYPKSFEELLEDEREKRGLPREREINRVSDRRRNILGVVDEPKE